MWTAADRAIAVWNDERTGNGDPPVAFGTALHLGDVSYGNIGAPDRLDFTVIGSTVNLASRLEEQCKALSCRLLMTAGVADYLGSDAVPLGRVDLDGISAPTEVFTLETLGRPT